MKKGFKKKFLIYNLILIPSILFGGKILISLFIKFLSLPFLTNKETIEIKPSVTIDLITGINRYQYSKKDSKKPQYFVNRHGLVKTIFNSNKNNNKIYGIGITGDSVAVGYPLTIKGEYQNTFVNLLEKDLRRNNEFIDIVNLSANGFNSWQENSQLAKYLNTNSFHSDLPDLKLVARLGGIQDFWAFINLISPLHDQKDNAFYKASGLMSLRKKEQDLFFREISKASKGEISAGFKIFTRSIMKNFQNSIKELMISLEKTQIYINYKKSKLERNSANLPKDSLQITNYKDTSINQIISSKLEISKEEYIQKKNIVTDSVIRNMESMISLNKNQRFIFIILPTRFGYSEIQTNIKNRYSYNNLNVNDLYFLEKDYKNNLLNKLKKLKKIKVHDLSNYGEDDWFFDESHYSRKGHQEIAKIIYPIFFNVINN